MKKSQNIITMIVVRHLDVNQWKSSSTVIDWFKGIDNIKYCIFIKFDIRKFYPSILESILKKRLSFASEYYHIPDEDIRILPKMFIIQ